MAFRKFEDWISDEQLSLDQVTLHILDTQSRILRKMMHYAEVHGRIEEAREMEQARVRTEQIAEAVTKRMEKRGHN